MIVRMRRIAGWTCLCFAMTSFLSLPRRVTAEDIVTPLPFRSFGDMAVDETGRRVFVTGAEADNAVAVLDFDGRLRQIIGNEAGARDIVVSNGALWVLATSAAAIDEIDLSTLQRRARHPLGAQRPVGLELVGSRLWFSFLEGETWTGSLGVFDLTTRLVQRCAMRLYYAGLASTPALPDGLLVFEQGLSPGTIYKYDVSRYPAAPIRRAWHWADANTQYAAFWPDGSRFVLPSGGAAREYVWSTFRPNGVHYPTGGSDPTVAAAARAGLLAVGTSSARVILFPVGDPVELKRWQPGGGAKRLYSRGLEFSADGSKIFAVDGDSQVEDVEFRVLDTSAYAPSPTPTPILPAPPVATPVPVPIPTPIPSVIPTATPAPSGTPVPCDTPSERTMQVGAVYVWLDGIWRESNRYPGLQRRATVCEDGSVAEPDHRLVATGTS